MPFTDKQQEQLLDFIDESKFNVEVSANANFQNFADTVNLPDVLILNTHDDEAIQTILAKTNEFNQKVEDPNDRITLRVAAGGDPEKKYSHSFSLTPLVESDIILHINTGPLSKETAQIIHKKISFDFKPHPAIKDEAKFLRIATASINHYCGKKIAELHDGVITVPEGPLPENFNLMDFYKDFTKTITAFGIPSVEEVFKINTKTTIKIKPGCQVKELDDYLYENGLATKNRPSLIDRTTPFGLTAAGCHGSNLDGKAYADNVESFTVIAANGTKQKIDSTTNPERFAAFNPAHLGLLGPVVEMELDCELASKYETHRIPMSLPEFLENVRTGKLPNKDFPLFSVFYVPTYNHDLENRDVKNILVIQAKPVPLNTEDQNTAYEARGIEQAIEASLEDGLPIPEILANFPELVPAYMNYIVARFSIGFETVISVGPAPKEYHYQVEYPKRLNDVDVLFATDENCIEMVRAFEKTAEEMQRAKENGEAPVTFGAYARLLLNDRAAAEKSIAAGCHDNDKKYVCGFDIVSSPNATGFEDFRDTMVRFLVDELLGKLHWGKYVPVDKDIDYKKMYGAGLTNVKEQLIKYHQDNNLDIARSPFLTPFLCETLGFPEYMPTATKQGDEPIANNFVPEFSAINPLKKLQTIYKFLNWVKEQEQHEPTEHIAVLKQQVKQVKNTLEKETSPVSQNRNSFYPQAPEIGQAPPAVRQEVTSNKCCIAQ
ncbi:MAG: FAD-binding protein [Legionella sp.]|uniref:FAD-binding protein n=1 Tax=Legionella sp. TaxID=459 RepID=UPI0028463E82|nr:FAD-binding protein [Legionella sp.]